MHVNIEAHHEYDAWTVVDKAKFEAWLKSGSPDYRVSAYGNVSFYEHRFTGKRFAFEADGVVKVDPKHLL